MVDKAALQTELDELKAARHKLLLGGQEAEVRLPDRTIKFNATGVDRITARIRELEVQLQAPGRRRAIGVSL